MWSCDTEDFYSRDEKMMITRAPTAVRPSHSAHPLLLIDDCEDEYWKFEREDFL